MIKMFQDKDLGPLSNEQTEFLSKMSDSNERMIKLVNNMLTLNHTEDTILKFNMESTDVNKLLEETIFEFIGESHKKGIELVYINNNSNIPNINCDKEMVRVVLQNLIENAIKYSDTNDKVFISTKLDNGMLEISVHDTGIGISEADRAHIFDKFYRANNAKDKDSIGSGLGLFTAKKIVEYHHGRMWFDSEEKVGTTFFIALPTNTSVV
jgi:signal transduction histidine kinase